MRKLIAMLMAMVMLLVPMTGMAASPAELLDQAWANGSTVTTKASLELGDLPIPEETKAVVEDFVNALGLRTMADPDGKMQFALTLQGQDALALAGEAAGDDIYVNLPLVAGQTMAFNPDEALVVLERLVKMLLEASGLSEAELQQLESAFTMGVQQGLTVAESAMLDEFVMPEIDVNALLSTLMGSMEEIAAPVQPADCDPVTAGVKINITPEAVESLTKVVCDIIVANPQLMASLEEADLELTAEEWAQVPAAAAQAVKESLGVIPVTLLMNDAGDLLYADVVMTPVDGSPAVSLSYAGQTKEDGKYHTVNIMEGGEGACLLLVDSCVENKTEYGFAVFLLEAGQKSGVVFDSGFTQTRDRNDQKAHDVTTLFAIIPTGDSAPASVTVALTLDQLAEVLGNGAQCDTTVKLNCDLLGGDILTVKVNTVADDTEMPSLVSEAAIRPGAMTEEAFAGFIEAVPNYALTTVFGMLQLLPESVLMLLMAE